VLAAVILIPAYYYYAKDRKEEYIEDITILHPSAGLTCGGARTCFEF